jgi:hypothetical protein
MKSTEITIGNIIENSHNTRQENLDKGWVSSYNLQYKLGKYTLSIALGESMYCAPQEIFPHPSAYETVEVGILDDGKLMSLTEIVETFGDGVARYCEDYSNGGFGGSTVMPYVEWVTVAYIANEIKRIEGVNTPKWENEVDEPF